MKVDFISSFNPPLGAVPCRGGEALRSVDPQGYVGGSLALLAGLTLRIGLRGEGPDQSNTLVLQVGGFAWS